MVLRILPFVISISIPTATLATIVACSPAAEPVSLSGPSSDGEGGGEARGAPPDSLDAAVDARREEPDAGSLCNALPPTAQPATLHLVTMPEPAPTGGPLVNGTYVLKDVTRYGLTMAEADRLFLQRAAVRYEDGVVDFVISEPAFKRVKRSTSSITTSGTDMKAKDTCPSTAEHQFSYSATGDELLLFGTFLGSRMVERFVRTAPP